MANRYWVGGSGTWNTSSTTNWSATSGGASGASVPTAADAVFFDQAGTYTVTCTGALTCLDFTVSTGTVTFAQGTSPTFSIRGSMFLVAGTLWTATGTVNFTATSTGKIVTTNGTTFPADVQFNGVGGGWTLGSAMTTGTAGAYAFAVLAGTFTTANYNITCSAFQSTGALAATINLGSSTVTTTTNSVNFSNSSLTFNAGTSLIQHTGSFAFTFTGGGKTFYDFSISTTGTLSTATINGANTFNNFAVAANAAAGVREIRFTDRQTINGTLSTTGTAGNRRVWFRGTTYGIAQTLTINSAPSLTDADFRDIYVVGTAAPISGTRIGDLRGIRGITASTPKTVYWNTTSASTYGWSHNAWALASGGAVSTDNFPLAQDTAVFNNSSTIGTLILSTDAICEINATARTSSWTLSSTNNTVTIYGNLALGSGVTMAGTQAIVFSGRNTQTITSAGKTFSQPITIDSYGGTVQLGDAFNIGTNILSVTNGTFNTQNYNVTAGSLSSSSTNVRAINLGSSTVTLSTGSGVGFLGANFTFNAGTSTINLAGSAGPTISGGVTFYNVSVSALPSGGSLTLTGANTFNNLTVLAPVSASLGTISVQANQTITGTLTVSGASPIRRIFLRSDTLGTQRDLTVGTLVADDCDFRDIEILGAAIGTAPTRAGDCGGNNNITFPSAKTVYWNLSGTQNWSDTGWASSSGGTPDINNFPLAQDTAVFDNTGSVTGTITVNAAWNIGTFDASTRTSAMTFTNGGNTPVIYGDWKFGTGVAHSSSAGTLLFSKRGTQTITSNGVAFGCQITITCFTGTVQLADALTLIAARTLAFTSGTFDAVSYNVTVGVFASSTAGPTGGIKVLKMGSGLWTLSGTGTVFAGDFSTNAALYKGTADILLSDTSTTGRTFAATGSGASYNKLTIGGTTGTSTTTFSGTSGCQFTELASTKTVAHTLALGTGALTLGKWSITGTAGNVVTVTGTATLTIAGARVSGVDYLAMGTTAVSPTSPGEFYAGVNSTGTGSGVLLTIAQPASTYYWVGGSGTWNATSRTNWAITSGGAAGVYGPPTSADHVVFDSASNATAYTVTCTATQLRCASLTISGPASGNVTWAGTAPLAIHGNVTLAATGITRTYSGAITLSGSSTGKTFTTNGVGVVSPVTVDGVGCGWALGSAWVGSSTFTITNGSFDTANYAVTGNFVSNNSNSRSLSFGSSTVTIPATATVSFVTSTNFTFNAGTSSIVCTANTPSLSAGAGQTFYDCSFTSVGNGQVTITGANTFNNLSVTGTTSVGVKPVTFNANQTINGTLTLSPGTDATMRTFVRSDTIGTPRTLTCAAVTATDIDFRDITIAGAAAPVSGTRLGDCKGNSGITFDAAKTVYYRSTGPTNWGDSIARWSFTNGGTADFAAFPLAQDTAVFPSSPTPYPSSGSSVTINTAFNIGTIDMSARTSNTMTLSQGNAPTIYGNWVNGTGVTLSGSGNITFSGRGAQTVTSAGKPFGHPFIIDSPGGSVTLQDSWTTTFASTALTVTRGTFDAGGYNVTLSSSTGTVALNNTNVRTVAVGIGTWTIAGGGANAWNASTPTNLTVTGTGTISLTSASAKTFAGGGKDYSGITLNQGGAGALDITGNNTFANISNSYKATGATSITLGTTTQTVANFTASGEAGRVLTVQGTSASSPATLIFSGAGQATQPTTDYLTITGVRAYSLDTTWYAGANSTNNGSLGWYFEAGGGGPILVYIIESSTASSAESPLGTYNPSVSETTALADSAIAGMLYLGELSESATVADSVSAFRAFLGAVVEAAVSSEVTQAAAALSATLAEAVQAAETAQARAALNTSVQELTQGADATTGGLLFLSSILEASQAQELAAAVTAFNRSVSESAVTFDAVQVIASTFSAAASDTARPLDTPKGANTGTSSLSETLTASETASTKFNPSTSVSEQATAQETAAAKAMFSGPVLETATAVDQAGVAPSNFSAVALAAAQAAESFNPAGSMYNAVLITQGAAALDALRRSKLRTVNLEDFVFTDAAVPPVGLEALVTSNTASGTVESGQITATVLP